MNSKFKIGDTVKVIKSGASYSNYDTMAQKMKLKNWRPGGCENGMICEVVAIESHEDNHVICIGIRVESIGRDYVIGEYGLELVAPKLWAIKVTNENYSIVNAWWKNKVTSIKNNMWIDHFPSGVPIGYTILSEHPDDTSYYWSDDINQLISNHPEYTPITLEQFIQITKQENNMKTLDPNTKITISRDLLNQYYDAATSEQRKYINDNFKIDGTTTAQGIIGLHDMACGTWKPKIKQNHPECFVVESKEFDFSKMVDKKLFSEDVIKALGIEIGINQFLEVRSGGEYENKAFWLNDDFNWELKRDNNGEWALIPTRK